MDKIKALVSLGRFMTSNAGMIQDDATCNRWARVGKLLMEVGVPFAPQMNEFCGEDRVVVLEGARVMGGKLPMPEMMVVREVPERRTRRARMTGVMRREKEPRASKKEAVASAPKKRGRPRRVVA